MVAAVGAIGSSGYDSEYIKIIQELKKLGLVPTGNKSTDKTKLEHAKTELIQKIQTRENNEQKQNLQVQPVEAAEDTQKSRMEELRPGAMNVAELNKLYFGL